MSRLRSLLFVALTLSLLGADWRAMLSPGHVVDGHAEIEGQCDKCHVVFEGVPDGRCLACHEAIATREASGEGFHAGVQDQVCVACHVDHGGARASATRDEARRDFDHAETGFALGGKHRRVKCRECHDQGLETLADACTTCHVDDDVHASALGPECEACHVDSGFGDQLKTLGAHILDTSGGHEGLGCTDCHLHGDNLDGNTVCADCHDQSHGGTTSDCADCHQVSGFTPASFDHGPCGCSFPGKHQTVTCLACHEDFRFTGTPTLCSGCHEAERPHEPLGECSQCHTALSWSEGRFDHAQAAFALDGAHLSVSCDQCHDGQFRGVPKDCAGCHAEAGDVAHGDFGACEPCHATTGFTPSSFDHATVSFPLTGRHAKAPCQECHDAKVEGYRETATAP